MHLDGFHYTDGPSHHGFGVPPELIELSEPAQAKAQRVDAWTYDESIPEDGRGDADYFYSHEDLAHLMQRPVDEIAGLGKAYGWRTRKRRTADERVKEVYLFDLLATHWGYMLDYFGHKIDLWLLEEARAKQASQ